MPIALENKKRVVILGGGFGGIYTAMRLESLRSRKDNFDIILINRENYFVYQPMLAEVVGGTLGILDTVNAIRKLLPKTKLYIREIESVDLQNKNVILAPKFSHKTTTIPYDHLVVSLGNVTDFRGISGLYEHALSFKNLADAVTIRNQLIDVIEAADIEKDPEKKKQLLTFVVGGGGFSGTEVVAEINDYSRKLVKSYPDIDPSMIRVVLVHSKDRLMERELSESLSRYAEKLLKKRGVEIYFGCRLVSATPNEAVLDNGERIPSKTVISTVPSSPNPVVEAMDLPKIKNRLKTDRTMQVESTDNIWTLGDCAAIPTADGKGICPPTAQFAIREAKVLADNIFSSMRGKKKKEFYFKALGMLGALGHRRAVAELFGFIKFSGLLAWFFWRVVYWMKLPGFNRKVKVALSWMLDTIIPIEPVQLRMSPSQGIARLHFEEGEIIFNEGDVGDYLYIIVEGKVEVIKEGKAKPLATLGKGEFFGEMALLNQKTRTATIRCIEPTDVLALRKADFGVLITNFEELRTSFEETEKKRKRELG
ncbi:MAG: FAD-dependent oxidoreductase [Simkaniaceae bacterium]